MQTPQLTQPGGAFTNAMELSDLQTHIRTLITLEPDEAPLVSCYVHRVSGRNDSSDATVERRRQTIRKVFVGQPLEHFEEAIERIEDYLATEVRLTTRGVAMFARAGTQPFFLGLQFQVPLPERLSVCSTPDILHLVELKDTYHRYVVLISTEKRALILEVNLGAVTREVWAERPELRERVGREWTHQHYQNHRRDRGEQFLKEKFDILEKLMTAGGHTHLILAGNPQLTARIKNRLPKHLRAKLIDVVHASSKARVADVIEATLSTFIEREQQESLDAVAALVSALRRGGLGVAGTEPTFEALRHCQADLLVMALNYEPGPAWGCRHCGWANAMSTAPERCVECESSEIQSVNLKEVMVMLAERQSLKMEFVEYSDVLMELGGVGCLLRYATPEVRQWP